MKGTQPEESPPGSSPTRDLRGYGAQPPHPCWPGNARIALQFVINYEEGGERTLLNGDGESEAFLSEIVGAVPWTNQRHLNMESLYDYGARVGFWRLHRLFTERRCPVTVFAVARAMELNPGPVEAMLKAGWEVASHGYRWIDYRSVAADVEREHIHKALDIHRGLVGAPPAGWYTGRTSVHTRTLVLAATNLLYDADSYADELPFWVQGPQAPHLVVPYTLDANDMRFATAQGFNSGDQFLTYLRDTFDQLYEEGVRQPAMMSVGLHGRLAGRPGRARALARFLDYVLNKDKVWIATREQIASHWRREHPPQEGVGYPNL